MLIVVFLLICNGVHARYFNGAYLLPTLKSSNMQHITKLATTHCETLLKEFNTCKQTNCETCLVIKNNYNIQCQSSHFLGFLEDPI